MVAKLENIETTEEYEEGWMAWSRARPPDPYGADIDTAACPYASGRAMNDKRVRFLSGWWSGYVNDWLERFEAK